MESINLNAMIMETERLVLERLAPGERVWARNQLVHEQLESDVRIIPVEEAILESSQEDHG